IAKYSSFVFICAPTVRYSSLRMESVSGQMHVSMPTVRVVRDAHDDEIARSWAVIDQTRPNYVSVNRREPTLDAGFGLHIKIETCLPEGPLPLGEGAAKAAGDGENGPSSGPSGVLLPEGEGTRPPVGRPMWDSSGHRPAVQ